MSWPESWLLQGVCRILLIQLLNYLENCRNSSQSFSAKIMRWGVRGRVASYVQPNRKSWIWIVPEFPKKLPISLIPFGNLHTPQHLQRTLKNHRDSTTAKNFWNDPTLLLYSMFPQPQSSQPIKSFQRAKVFQAWDRYSSKVKEFWLKFIVGLMWRTVAIVLVWDQGANSFLRATK